MKVRLAGQEWFPVLIQTDRDTATEFEVSDSVWNAYTAAMDKFLDAAADLEDETGAGAFR